MSPWAFKRPRLPVHILPIASLACGHIQFTKDRASPVSKARLPPNSAVSLPGKAMPENFMRENPGRSAVKSWIRTAPAPAEAFSATFCTFSAPKVSAATSSVPERSAVSGSFWIKPLTRPITPPVSPSRQKSGPARPSKSTRVALSATCAFNPCVKSTWPVPSIKVPASFGSAATMWMAETSTCSPLMEICAVVESGLNRPVGLERPSAVTTGSSETLPSIFPANALPSKPSVGKDPSKGENLRVKLKGASALLTPVVIEISSGRPELCACPNTPVPLAFHGPSNAAPEICPFTALIRRDHPRCASIKLISPSTNEISSSCTPASKPLWRTAATGVKCQLPTP